MKGVFIIRDKDVDTEYNEVDDITDKFDKVIRFAPTGAESTYREKLDELLKRQKKMIFRNYK